MHLNGRRRTATALIVALLLATACSHRTLHVEREMVLPPAAPVHEIESNQRFVMATPIEDPDPAYPDGAHLEGDLQLCTGFTVTAEGDVVDIAFDREDAVCADPAAVSTAAFAEATRVGLTQWRYFGAAVCTFPEGHAPDAEAGCDGPQVRVDAVPIRLRYVFTFSSVRGGRVWRSASPRS